MYIRRLRKALAPFGFDRFIQTVRGTGYRFSVKAAKASERKNVIGCTQYRTLTWQGRHRHESESGRS